MSGLIFHKFYWPNCENDFLKLSYCIIIYKNKFIFLIIYIWSNALLNHWYWQQVEPCLCLPDCHHLGRKAWCFRQKNSDDCMPSSILIISYGWNNMSCYIHIKTVSRVDWHGTAVGVLGGEDFLDSSLNWKVYIT